PSGLGAARATLRRGLCAGEAGQRGCGARCAARLAAQTAGLANRYGYRRRTLTRRVRYGDPVGRDRRPGPRVASSDERNVFGGQRADSTHQGGRGLALALALSSCGGVGDGKYQDADSLVRAAKSSTEKFESNAVTMSMKFGPVTATGEGAAGVEG